MDRWRNRQTDLPHRTKQTHACAHREVLYTISSYKHSQDLHIIHLKISNLTYSELVSSNLL